MRKNSLFIKVFVEKNNLVPLITCHRLNTMPKRVYSVLFNRDIFILIGAKNF
jgi:hypothetical protein